MAFKILQQGTGKAISLGRDEKQVQGFLVSVKETKRKKGRGNASHIYTLAQDKGEPIQVWGNYQIDSVLLDSAGELHKNLVNRFVRLTFKAIKKLDKGHKLKEIEVAVDDARKMKKKFVPF